MSYIEYIIIAGFALSFAHFSDRANPRDQKILSAAAWLIIVVFIGIRFDVGADYKSYSEIFHVYTADVLSVRVRPDYFSYYVLSRLFGHFERGYVFVLSFYGLTTYLVLFSTLVRKRLLFGGLLAFLTFTFFIDSIDRVRQALAIVIVLSAMEHIWGDDANFRVFLVKIVVAGFFHLTALFVLPLFWIAKIRLSKPLFLLLYVVLLLNFFFRIDRYFVGFLYNHVPYYSSIYGGTHGRFTSQFNTGLGFLSKTAFVLAICLFSPIDSNRRAVLFTGIAIMMLAPGNLNFERFARYYIVAIVPAFALWLKYRKNLFSTALILTPLIFYLSILFLFELQARSNIEYRSVFSTEFEMQTFGAR